MRGFVARGVVLMAMVAAGWSVNQVWAETITFQFTGTVTTVNPATIDAIGGTDVVDVGDKLTGSFTYDLNTPGTTGGTGPGGMVIRTDYSSPVPPGNLCRWAHRHARTRERGDYCNCRQWRAQRF